LKQTYFSVWGDVLKRYFGKAKRSRITQRTEACPIHYFSHEAITTAGRRTPHTISTFFSPPEVARILRASTLASIRNPQGKCSLHSHNNTARGERGGVVTVPLANVQNKF
jgi:hypothetical protein